MLLNTPDLDREIQDLLARAMYPDPERIERTIQQYCTRPDWQVFAWEVDGRAVSAAGLQVSGRHAALLHLGTHPQESGKGHARALIDALVQELHLTELTAETDDHAIGFYRRLGFESTELPNEWNTRRYRCTLRLRPAT